MEAAKKIICSPAGNTGNLLPATISVRRDISDRLNSGFSGRELLFAKGPKSLSANCLPSQFTDSNGGCTLFLKCIVAGNCTYVMSRSWNGFVSKSGMEQLDNLNSRLRPFVPRLPGWQSVVSITLHYSEHYSAPLTENKQWRYGTPFFWVKDALQKKKKKKSMWWSF